MYNEKTAETASVCVFIFLNLALFIITANKNTEMLTAVTRGAHGEITFVRSTYYKLRSVATGIGHVLNEQGTGHEHIFSWCEYSISIELKMGHVI